MSEVDGQLQIRGLARGKEDPYLVVFKDDSKSNPRNWPWLRRAFDTGVLMFIQFFVTAMSTAGTSLGSFAKADYGLTRTTSLLVFVLAYQLGKVVGSITLPPWSETFGRKSLYIACCLIYSIMTLVAGVVPHVAGAIIGRIFSGMFSSAGGSVAAGSMQDMYAAEARIWVIFIWTSASTSGLALGPVYGSYIGDALGWRWGFYIAAIVMFATACVCLDLRESRPSTILQRELQEMKSSTGCTGLHCDLGNEKPRFKTFLSGTLFRPLYFFFTEPIVMTVVTISAIVYSLVFLFTESLTIVFMLDGFTEVQTSLFFLPLLIGIVLSTCVQLYEMRSFRRRNQSGKASKPEDKLFGFVLGAGALAIGLWWFAWTTPQAVYTHWIVPSIALVIIGFAINELEYVLSGYLTDCYGTYAGSAVGSMSTLRAALSGSLPLFAYFMFTGISTNAASSILAGMATAFCIAPVVFLRYGEVLRERSRFAVSSLSSADQ